MTPQTSLFFAGSGKYSSVQHFEVTFLVTWNWLSSLKLKTNIVWLAKGHPVDSRGGKLQIAGVVVGSWGPNAPSYSPKYKQGYALKKSQKGRNPKKLPAVEISRPVQVYDNFHLCNARPDFVWRKY